MRRRAPLALLVAALAACGAAGPDLVAALRTEGVTVSAPSGEWRQLSSARGYRFAMPGVPVARSDRRAYNIGTIATTLFELSLEDDAKVFVLTAFDGRALAHDDAKLLYDGLTDEERAHGTLVSEHDVTLPNGSAHEMAFDEHRAGRHSRIRVVWTSGFVLRAVAIFDDGHEDDAAIRRFFDSLAAAP